MKGIGMSATKNDFGGVMPKIPTQNIKIYFGKYRGYRLVDVPNDYLSWIYIEYDKSEYLQEAAHQVLQERGINPIEAYEEGARKLRLRQKFARKFAEEEF